MKPLKRAIFLPCKNHVEDDISRKLTDPGNGAMKDEVLKDIFGNDNNKEKGIVDSMIQDEFFAEVIAVTDKWDASEKFNHPDKVKEPAFSEYFRANRAEDMKNGMLLPVRRDVGLDDGFFYNNGQECANFKNKSKITEEKMQGATRLSSKHQVYMGGGNNHLQEDGTRCKSRQTACCAEEGSILLSREYNHLEVPLPKWSKMTQSQKQKHLAKVDGSFKKGDEFTVDHYCDVTGIAT